MIDTKVAAYFEDPALDTTHWRIWSQPIGDYQAEPTECAMLRLGAILAAHVPADDWRQVADQWVPGLTRLCARQQLAEAHRVAWLIAMRAVIYAADVGETDQARAIALSRRPTMEPPAQKKNGDGTTAASPEYIRDIARRVVKTAEGDSPACVPTPFSLLNWYLAGGFYPGDLVYLGGRPSTGKTALVLQFLATAVGQGIASLLISAEMDNESIGRRILSQVGGLNATALRQARDVDHEALARTVARVWDWSLWITDKTRTASAILSVLDQVPQPVRFLVVDYLQLLSLGPRRSDNRRQEIEAISSKLKSIAVERSMPVVVLSGLTRPARSGTKTAASTMADLRESGALEHDADVVLILNRESAGAEDVLLTVSKNREGQTGDVQLHFDAQSVRFGVKEKWNED